MWSFRKTDLRLRMSPVVVEDARGGEEKEGREGGRVRVRGARRGKSESEGSEGNEKERAERGRESEEREV